MFKRALAVVMLGSCVICPRVVMAQERAPHAGSTAVGIDVGAFMPAESQFDNALIVNALLESLRHATRQSPHGLRIDRSRFLA